MGEVVKIKKYEPLISALKGLKTAGMTLAGIAGGAILLALEDPELVTIILGQAKISGAAAVAISGAIAAYLNRRKHKDN